MAGRAHSQYNQISHPMGGQLTAWKIITLQSFSHRKESSEPRVRHPSLGWGGLAMGGAASGFEGPWGLITVLHRTGGNRNSILEDAHNILYAPGPWGKAVTPQKPGPDLHAGLGRVPKRRQGWLWLTLAVEVWGNTQQSGDCYFDTKTQPHLTAYRHPVLGCGSPNNQHSGNTGQLITRQAA